jgi:hypothetical protein
VEAKTLPSTVSWFGWPAYVVMYVRRGVASLHPRTDMSKDMNSLKPVPSVFAAAYLHAPLASGPPEHTKG